MIEGLIPLKALKAALRRCKSAALAATLVLGLSTLAPKPAEALTIVIDFVPSLTTDIFGVSSVNESFASWGFTGLDVAGVRSATLAAVMQDYLGYPSVGANLSSPLPNGKELNINFTVSTGLTGAGNGDTEWNYMAVGDAQPNQGFLGQACLGCVRNSAGVSTSANGSIVGSILTDSIAGLLSLATTDAMRINLLVGTVAHEIGHTLTLVHPSSALANPGASSYSIMATGVAPTSMPSAERVKDRAFAYTEFNTLIQTVGLRDVSPVPEPTPALLLALGVVSLVLRMRAVRI